MPSSYDIERLLPASLEDVLLKLYPATFLRWLYDVGLRKLAAEHPDTLPQTSREQRFGTDKTPKKTYLIELTLAVLKDKTLGRSLFEALPQATRDAIAVVTWEKRVTIEQLEKTVGHDIATVNPDQQRIYYEPFLLHPEQGFLTIRKTGESYWSYSRDREKPKKQDYSLRLPDAIRRVFKTFVTAPPDFELLPLGDPPAKAGVRYSCGEKAIADLRMVAEYITQGHLKFTKSERVAMPSLRAIHRLTNGPEFFNDSGDSGQELLRTRLLVAGMAFAGEKEREQLLTRTDDATPVRSLFEKVSANAAFLHEELLAHLANSQNRWCDYDMRSVRAVATFFGKLPVGKWVAWENVRRYYILRDVTPTLFAKPMSGLHARLAHSRDTWPSSVYVDERNAFELVSEPLLKGYAFLLAAFGLAEIVYTSPTSAGYRLPKKGYLTPFDGLRFVRLTPLGEFVFGRRDAYEVADGPPTRSVVTLDGARLLATCRDADALTELALAQFFETLTPGRYRMTPKSLLGGCRSRADIEERIRLFRRVVSANPPPVWERFFDRTLARIGPLELEADYVVLKVSADDDIRRLFATDPALRGLALKVEGLRIAVRRGDLKPLVKRLEQLGYLSPLASLTDPLRTDGIPA